MMSNKTLQVLYFFIKDFLFDEWMILLRLCEDKAAIVHIRPLFRGDFKTQPPVDRQFRVVVIV